MMKNIWYLFLIMICFGAFAQQDADPHYTQYMFNRMSINPASTAVNDVMSAAVFYRNQWINTPGAPVNQLVTFQAPLKDKKMGLGGSVLNDKIGFESRINIAFNGAYHIRTEKAVYSMGLQAGVKQNSFDHSQSTIKDPSLPNNALQDNLKTAIMPDFAFGFNYTRQNFYGGFSIFHLNQSRIRYSGTKTDARLKRHYYLNFGYNYALDPYFTLKPSVLLRMVPNAPFQADFSLLLDYNGGFWGGLNYRSKDALGIIIGVQLNKLNIHVNQAIRIGYAFDYTTARLPRYNSGSHEIMVQYDFRRKDKVHTPKFMKLE